jgi:hypothetical protein
MYSIKLLSMAFCLAIRVVPHSQGNLSSYKSRAFETHRWPVHVNQQSTEIAETPKPVPKM